MAIIFPINPNIGQSLYLENTRYIFDGIAWIQSVSNSLGSRNSKKFTSILNQVQYQCQFSVSNAEIFVNGIKLDSSDYTVNNDGLVTLNSTLDVGTNVEVVGYGIYDILHEIYFRQSTEPENPVDGALWFNTETNIIKCYDEISQTWIVPLTTQTAINEKAPINSPVFTGTPKAPTAITGTNTQQLATTSFVQNLLKDTWTNASIAGIKTFSSIVTVYPLKQVGGVPVNVDGQGEFSESEILLANPVEIVDGFEMLPTANTINPFESYDSMFGTSGTYAPAMDNNSSYPGFIDIPVKELGGHTIGSGYTDNQIQESFTSNKKVYLGLYINIDGSPHRQHATYIQAGSRHYGAYNGRMWWEVAYPSAQEMRRVSVNSHFGDFKIQNTEYCGPNNQEDTKYNNNGLYRITASGYGSGDQMGSDYGGWVFIPLFGSTNWNTVRVWNWGHLKMYVKGACVILSNKTTP